MEDIKKNIRLKIQELECSGFQPIYNGLVFGGMFSLLDFSFWFSFSIFCVSLVIGYIYIRSNRKERDELLKTYSEICGLSDDAKKMFASLTEEKELF